MALPSPKVLWQWRQAVCQTQKRLCIALYETSTLCHLATRLFVFVTAFCAQMALIKDGGTQQPLQDGTQADNTRETTQKLRTRVERLSAEVVERLMGPVSAKDRADK